MRKIYVSNKAEQNLEKGYSVANILNYQNYYKLYQRKLIKTKLQACQTLNHLFENVYNKTL